VGDVAPRLSGSAEKGGPEGVWNLRESAI
jgi:hypothetical protein